MERRIYAIPKGNWYIRKSDKGTSFHLDAESDNGLPFWSPKDRDRLFQEKDLNRICSLSLTARGVVTVLSEYGPWNVEHPHGIKEFTCPILDVEYFSWWRIALRIHRARFLWSSLRRGEAPVWTRPDQFGYQVGSWPKKLRCGLELPEFRLPLEYLDKGDPDDWNTAREFGKALLAQLINNGLRLSDDLPHGLYYDEGRFIFDVTYKEPHSLQTACWLLLRDLAANLRGLRFCQAPGCCNPIAATRNKGAKTCGTSRCKKRRQRARKVAVNG